MNLRLSFVFASLIAAAVVAGCADRVVTKPTVIRVPVETRATVPDALTAPCAVVEPDPACWYEGAHVFCNGQVATMIEDYRHAVAACSADKAVIRSQFGMPLK